MPNKIVTVSGVLVCVLAGVFLSSPAVLIGSPDSDSAKTIWGLEHSYWQYVQENNLTAYLSLWHKDFLGWPYVNDAPVRKDHITDWITSQTSKGLAFKLIEFKPASIQASGDTVVVCYWVTSQWVGKDGTGTGGRLRVTHTWIKNGKDWQIVGGMSMEEPAVPRK